MLQGFKGEKASDGSNFGDFRYIGYDQTVNGARRLVEGQDSNRDSRLIPVRNGILTHYEVVWPESISMCAIRAQGEMNPEIIAS